MDQQRAVADLFECCAKRRQQVRRQRANESDRVVDYYFLFARQTQAARSRIERGKHALLGVYVALGQCIQEGRFAGVGVTHDRDHWKSLSCSSFATFLTALSLCLDLTFQTIDAIADAATIGFELCFT